MRVFITDGEGPVTKNDNAFELTAHFIPGADRAYESIDGGRFFTVVSSYDDVLAYLIKRPNYKAGDTLRLILPFLKAFGADDLTVRDYSRRNIMVMPGIRETIRFIRKTLKVPQYIISTSYEHYVEAFCERIGFPFENVFCTRLELDKYPLLREEGERLKDLCREIAEMPVIEMPKKASSIGDLSSELQKHVERLNTIFWADLPQMESYRMIEEVNPIGGYEKANALEEIVERRGVDFSECVYYGDSITDVEAFKLTNKKGGLSVSFNGNVYAIREAQIAVLSYDTTPISLLTEAFCRHGIDYVFDLAHDWNRDSLTKSNLDKDLLRGLESYIPERLPSIYVVDEGNVDELAERSTAFRKKVRGEQVGRLG